jgi:hypothetical protein
MERSFAVYFDGSGAPDDTSVLAVAGLLADTAQWLAFERNWNEVLERFSAPPLHMRHFAHSLKEFVDWKGDESRRVAFLKALIAVMQLRVRHSFANAVVMKDYNDTASRYGTVFTPFALPGCTCIAKVQRWAKKWGIDEGSIEYIFEDGDKDKNDLARSADKHCHVKPIFMKKTESIVFQAADLLAYEYLSSNRKIYEVGVGILSLGDMRKPLQRLNDIPNGTDAEDWGIHDLESLEDAYSKGIVPS